MALNKKMATDSEINDIFAHLKDLTDALSKQGFSFVFTASVYNEQKAYTNEIYFENIAHAETRFLLFMHNEQIIKNQLKTT